MASKLESTATPGVFRRHAKRCARRGRCECGYVIVFRDRGRQRTETHATLSEAREAQRVAARRANLSKGHERGLHRDEARDECPDCARERSRRERSEPTLNAYAREWVGRYPGTGQRGFREETRGEYRSLLNRYALRFFPADTRLSDIDPRMVADFIGVARAAAKRPRRNAVRQVGQERPGAAHSLPGDS